MNTYKKVDIQLHMFLTLALDWGECLALLPGRFTMRDAYGLYGVLILH
jgi:hypothetical protein